MNPKFHPALQTLVIGKFLDINQTIASACIIKSAEWGAETDFGLKQPNWQLATILFWHFFGIN